MKQLIWLLSLCCIMQLHGQNAAEATTAAPKNAIVQPTIMVIPFTRDKEDVRKVLDMDGDRRLAIAKVKEAFDNRGFSTIDFVAKLKETETRQVFTSENLTDIKTQIIEFSGAEIYIEVDVQKQYSGTGNSANVVLTGYDASTGASLANKVAMSEKFHTQDFARLINRAVEATMEDFLNVLQGKFTDIVENGRLVAIEFDIAADSDLRMSTDIPGQSMALSDVLEIWIEEKALNGNYHLQGSSDVKVIFDQVRVPFRDKNGNNISTSKFSLDVLRFCTSLQKPGNAGKLQVKRQVKGNTIFITLS